MGSRSPIEVASSRLIGKTFDQPAWCEKDANRHGSLDSRGGHCKLSMAHYSSKTHVVDVARHHFMPLFFSTKWMPG